MSTGIKGKVVVITGASSGIGESTARHLAGKGALVALGARRKDRIDALAAEIVRSGGQAMAIATDVTKQSDVEVLVKGAVERFGQVDVIVNNSGVMPIAPMSLLKVDEWDRAIDTNIKGVLYGVAAVLPHFREAKGGHIINIASVAGIKVFAPGGTVYSATKSAVRALTEGLRIELRADNIRCTMVSPGLVESELKEGSSHEASSQALAEVYKVAIPAEAVAQAIAYAIEQPEQIAINEITVRPTVQEF